VPEADEKRYIPQPYGHGFRLRRFYRPSGGATSCPVCGDHATPEKITAMLKLKNPESWIGIQGGQP